jgi:hypothetical protein
MTDGEVYLLTTELLWDNALKHILYWDVTGL